MPLKENWTICRWCGAELGPDEDWMKLKNGATVVWCSDCDGLTFLKPEDDKDRNMVLLLEHRKMDAAPSSQEAQKGSVTPCKLRKRLSPLRYPGGKSKAIDTLYESLDDARLDIFVELFAGGASFGLSLLEAGKTNQLILNDADPCVANFWRAATQHTEQLISTIEQSGTPTADDFYRFRTDLKEMREQFMEQRKHRATSFAESEKPDEIEEHIRAAYKFLVVNRLSFGGMQMSNLLSGTSGNYLQRWNQKALIKRLRAISLVRDRITVRCEDAATLLLNELGWMPENTTIFVDPPYFEAGPKLYPYGFADGHLELAEVLNTFYRSYPGPNIIITYDDVKDIRDLYPYAEIKELGSPWSLRKPSIKNKEE